MRQGIWVAATVFSSLLGCKTTTTRMESKVDSLDVFATGAKGATCRGTVTPAHEERFETYWKQGSILAHEGFKDSLKSILAAVPAGLTQWYFLQGGSIRLVGNAAQICPEGLDSSINLYSSEGAVTGCVQFDASDQQTSMPKLYIGVSARTYEGQQIELAAAVQGFTVIFSSFLSELGQADSTNSADTISYTFGTNDEEMRLHKVHLSFALLDDIVDATHGGTQLPDMYRILIQSHIALDRSQPRDARWSALWNLHATGNVNFKKFANAALAHTMESVLCQSPKDLLAESSPFRQTVRYYLEKMHQPVMQALAAEEVPNKADAEPAIHQNNESGSGDSVYMALTGDYEHFPILRGIVRAPFAVGAYFVNNRPVRTFFAEYRPMRRAAVAVFRGGARIVGGVGRMVFPGDRCFRVRRRLC